MHEDITDLDYFLKESLCIIILVNELLGQMGITDFALYKQTTML